MQDLGPLRALRCLEALDVRETAVTELEAVGRLPHLRRLRLDGTGIHDLSALRHAPALEELTASRTEVREVGALARVRTLRVLDLSRTPVDDLSALRGMTWLETLDVRHTPISMANLEALERALPFTTIHTTVYDEEIARLNAAREHNQLAETYWLAARRARHEGAAPVRQCELATLARDVYRANLEYAPPEARARLRDLNRWRFSSCTGRNRPIKPRDR